MGSSSTNQDGQVIDHVALALGEIIQDFRDGILPVGKIHSFSDLHDYVDANEYGGWCDDEVLKAYENWDHEDFIKAIDDFQDRIDSILRDRG